jgi:hypothetical protein
MDPFVSKRNRKDGPEAKIQGELINFLKIRDWFVQVMIGNAYQFGIPDLFCTHTRYGHRWVEVKNPLKYAFTPAQLEKFPKLCANGSGVWVIVAATEFEYRKLFAPANWHAYLGIMTEGVR